MEQAIVNIKTHNTYFGLFSWERIGNGVEQAMMPITARLPLPPVTWGLRTRCEQRRERPAMGPV